MIISLILALSKMHQILKLAICFLALLSHCVNWSLWVMVALHTSSGSKEVDERGVHGLGVFRLDISGWPLTCLRIDGRLLNHFLANLLPWILRVRPAHRTWVTWRATKPHIWLPSASVSSHLQFFLFWLYLLFLGLVYHFLLNSLSHFWLWILLMINGWKNWFIF